MTHCKKRAPCWYNCSNWARFKLKCGGKTTDCCKPIPRINCKKCSRGLLQICTKNNAKKKKKKNRIVGKSWVTQGANPRNRSIARLVVFGCANKWLIRANNLSRLDVCTSTTPIDRLNDQPIQSTCRPSWALRQLTGRRKLESPEW